MERDKRVKFYIANFPMQQFELSLFVYRTHRIFIKLQEASWNFVKDMHHAIRENSRFLLKSK